MQGKNLRIVFMGTPELAAHCLEDLILGGYRIAGVVTAPDKPAGRGRKILSSAVKQMAIEHNLPLLQPENLKDAGFLQDLRELDAQLQVVVAFRMLPEAVWAAPPMGTFNMHASLLPQYRGAAPINWAIINGEKISGVSTFLIDHKIDTGRILLRRSLELSDIETAGSLHEKLKPLAAAIIRDTIDGLAGNSLKAVDQDEFASAVPLKIAPKIYRDTCRISWTLSCMETERLIRGLSPSPGAFCELVSQTGDIQIIRLIMGSALEVRHDFGPGTMFCDQKNELWFACTDGMLRITELQLPGKKAMKTPELLRGYRFQDAHPLPAL